MITYTLNAATDIFVLNGDIATILDPDQVAQDIKTKLDTFQGEFFLDINFGVPYFQTIFQKPANIGVFDTAIRSVILSSPGVAKIALYQSSIDSFKREYFVKFTVTLLDDSQITQTNNFTLTP